MLNPILYFRSVGEAKSVLFNEMFSQRLLYMYLSPLVAPKTNLPLQRHVLKKLFSHYSQATQIHHPVFK